MLGPQPPAAPVDLRAAFADRRAVVTGGAGFIGGRLAEMLLSLGAEVCIVDDLSTGDADFIASLVDAQPERARFVHASVLDPRSLDDAFERAGVVFHLAAISSVPVSMAQPERCLDVNVRGAVEVCQAARIAGARRIVFASSASVYGDAGAGPVSEQALPRPGSPYAASKLAAECVCAAWARSFGLPAVNLRLFNVYGPRQAATGQDGAVVASFVSRLAEGAPPIINGDGRQTRDLVFVDDACRAFLLAAAAPGLGNDADVFNIGAGAGVEIGALAALVSDIYGRTGGAPEHAPARPGDLRHSVADVDAAKSRLGFTPEVSLRDGVQRTIAHTRGDVIPFRRAERLAHDEPDAAGGLASRSL